jgi:micrococcal nuclease
MAGRYGPVVSGASWRFVGLALLVAVWTAAVDCGRGDQGPGDGGPAGSPEGGSLYRVTAVTDGDTFHVRFGGRDERVRMIGIDTPEVSWYGGEGGCFGAQAGHYTKRRLGGRMVGLAFDADQRDRYGRLLAYVYLGSELFNLTLVVRGYARSDHVPPNVRFAAVFDQAQAKADAAGLGLWSACPVT